MHLPLCVFVHTRVLIRSSRLNLRTREHPNALVPRRADSDQTVQGRHLRQENDRSANYAFELFFLKVVSLQPEQHR